VIFADQVVRVVVRCVQHVEEAAKNLGQREGERYVPDTLWLVMNQWCISEPKQGLYAPLPLDLSP
jgi:hypothetical protein